MGKSVYPAHIAYRTKVAIKEAVWNSLVCRGMVQSGYPLIQKVTGIFATRPLCTDRVILSVSVVLPLLPDSSFQFAMQSVSDPPDGQSSNCKCTESQGESMYRRLR